MGKEMGGVKLRPMKQKATKRRNCTDCFCFLLFVLFIAGLGVITTLAILDDGFERLVHGYDSFGNICNKVNKPVVSGHSGSYAAANTLGLKNVLIFNVLNLTTSYRACVQSCPDVHIKSVAEFKSYTLEHNMTFCLYNVTPGEYIPSLCPSLPILMSDEVGNRCVPKLKEILELDDHLKTLQTFLSSNSFKLSLSEFYQELPTIGQLILASLLISIVMVFLLRWIARLMITLTLLISVLGSIGLSAYLWTEYSALLKANGDALYTYPLIGVQTKAVTAFLVYAIAATVFAFVLTLIILIMRKRIQLVIRLFGEAQKALADMPMLFVMPLVTFVVLIMFLTYWILIAMMIYSFGEYDMRKTLLIGGFQVDKQHLLTGVWIYHVVALIWISEFIFACESMVVASSVAKWYFTKPKSMLRFPIYTAISNMFCYHLGSMALGSFLITLIRFPRYVLMFFQAKFKAAPGGSVAEYCSKMCICCMYCLEKFMLFINANAYTIIAIEGVSFCSAAQKAFAIVVENALRIATINSVGDFMLLLAKVAVSALTVLLAFFWLDIATSDFEQLKLQLFPLAVVAVISFLIAHCFFTIYEMVIDALMVCFCEDCRANDGSEERPYYMNNSLKAFVDESSTRIIIK